MTTTETLPDALSSPAAESPYALRCRYVPGTRKLRVLLISHTCQSRTEGQPKAQALARLPDIDLHLLTPARWMHYGSWRAAQPPVNPAYQCTIAPVRFPWIGPAQYFLHYYPQLPALLRTFRPDVIDLWEEPWGYVSAHACKLRNRLLPSAKVVSETEQNILKKLPFPFERFRRLTLKNADYAVARNREAITVIRAKGYAGPVAVVPNAVDTALFRPLDRAACRAALQMGGYTVGYIGRLVAEKGLLDMVDALPQCAADVRLLFIGSGPLKDEILHRAAELSLTDRVQILPGRPLEQIPEVMNALDGFILPSRTTARWKEQFGRVIIEANACGIPVVASDSAAIPDVVGGGGLIFPEGDPRALARAIMVLHDDPARARELGAIGRRQAESWYTWDSVAQRMATIYQTVTSTGKEHP